MSDEEIQEAAEPPVETVETVKAMVEHFAVSDDGLCFLRCLLEWDVNMDVIGLLEKPWKWQPEFDVWVKRGKPADGASALFDAWDAL